MSATITLTPELLAKLDDSAQRRSISHEEMLRIAIDNIWDYDSWMQKKVDASRASVARGKVYTQAEIEADDILLKQKILGQS